SGRLPAGRRPDRTHRPRPAEASVPALRSRLAARLGDAVPRRRASELDRDQDGVPDPVTMDVSTQGAGARDDYPGFRVAGWLDRFGSFVSRWPGLWIRLGNLETRLLSDEIAGIAIEAPIYVGGLARSGSTILLECLARHPD